eukprot:1847757-Prymnesium_polylepis.1
MASSAFRLPAEAGLRSPSASASGSLRPQSSTGSAPPGRYIYGTAEHIRANMFLDERRNAARRVASWKHI